MTCLHKQIVPAAPASPTSFMTTSAKRQILTTLQAAYSFRRLCSGRFCQCLNAGCITAASQLSLATQANKSIRLDSMLHGRSVTDAQQSRKNPALGETAKTCAHCQTECDLDASEGILEIAAPSGNMQAPTVARWKSHTLKVKGHIQLVCLQQVCKVCPYGITTSFWVSPCDDVHVPLKSVSHLHTQARIRVDFTSDCLS